MGMYTELNMAVALKGDTPQNIIDILAYMVGDSKEKPETPDHPLFETPRWDIMLNCDSYYFDGDTNSVLRKDEGINYYYLTIRSNFKNYNDEIMLFLHFIHPYITDVNNGFIGYFRYEEYAVPTLIYSMFAGGFSLIEPHLTEPVTLHDTWLRRRMEPKEEGAKDE